MFRPSLTPAQQQKCRLLHASGMPYKKVAREVCCTPAQARHYYRRAPGQKPPLTETQRKKAALAKRRLNRWKKDCAAALPRAKAMLAYEVAAAKAEAGVVDLFRPSWESLGL